MKNFEDISNATLKLVDAIQDLRIGDEITKMENEQPIMHCFVVAIFAEPGTLGQLPDECTGTIYGDFEDNPGDVLEFDLSQDVIYKILR